MGEGIKTEIAVEEPTDSLIGFFRILFEIDVRINPDLYKASSLHD